MAYDIDYVSAEMYSDYVLKLVRGLLERYNSKAEVTITQNNALDSGSAYIQPILSKDGAKYDINIFNPEKVYGKYSDSVSLSQFAAWAYPLMHEVEHLIQFEIFPTKTLFDTEKGIIRDYRYNVFESAVCNTVYSAIYKSGRIAIREEYTHTKYEKSYTYALFEIDARHQGMLLTYDVMSHFFGLEDKDKCELLDGLIRTSRVEETNPFFEDKPRFKGVSDRLQYLNDGYKEVIKEAENLNRQLTNIDFLNHEPDVFENNLFGKKTEREQNEYIIEAATAAQSKVWKKRNKALRYFSIPCPALKCYMNNIYNNLSPEMKENCLVNPKVYRLSDRELNHFIYGSKNSTPNIEKAIDIIDPEVSVSSSGKF